MTEPTKTIVIALGGNAILSEGDSGDAEQQMINMETACRQLAPLIRSGNKVVLTHGNGPQVGNLLIQQEESAPAISQQPLDICVGMTQGQIGTMLHQVLDKVLREERIQRDVVTLVSHFVVGEDDPEFSSAYSAARKLILPPNCLVLCAQSPTPSRLNRRDS